MDRPHGFCYVNREGNIYPTSDIDLFSFKNGDLEIAKAFLDEAAAKLTSVVVCTQVTDQVRNGIKRLQTLGRGKLGKARKSSIRLVSTHGLEYFTLSVPLRYKPITDDQDASERQIAAAFRSWPFNVFINICTWISPTNLRKLAANGNLTHFGEWCVREPILLQNIDIPEDAKDKAFAIFGESPIWSTFYTGTSQTAVDLSMNEADNVPEWRNNKDQNEKANQQERTSPPLAVITQMSPQGVLAVDEPFPEQGTDNRTGCSKVSSDSHLRKRRSTLARVTTPTHNNNKKHSPTGSQVQWTFSPAARVPLNPTAQGESMVSETAAIGPTAVSPRSQTPHPLQSGDIQPHAQMLDFPGDISYANCDHSNDHNRDAHENQLHDTNQPTVNNGVPMESSHMRYPASCQVPVSYASSEAYFTQMDGLHVPQWIHDESYVYPSNDSPLISINPTQLQLRQQAPLHY